MQNSNPPVELVPGPVLRSVLQEYCNDPQGDLSGYSILPLSTSGVSGNNSFYRADIAWKSTSPVPADAPAHLLIKRWTPGGLSQSEMGWSKPVEALAWLEGILRPGALPAGIITPIVASVVDGDGQAAWVAMRDVSHELAEYDRSSPLPADRLVSRLETILSGLARFHACWEQPAKQRFLANLPWLLPFENYLRRKSAFYVAILRKDVADNASREIPVTDEDAENLQTFLEWVGSPYRPLFTQLLVERSPLVNGFSDIPRTLLHGDLDDRNIGLSSSPSGTAELVLIDWEWMGCGPAAMDVAKLLIHASMMLEPGGQIPETCWSEELPDYYFEQYRLAGGVQLDHTTWRRSYDLALIAQAVWPFPIAIGAVLRTLQGKAPIPKIPGLTEEITRKLLSSSLENRQTIAITIMQAMGRCFLA